MHLVCHRKTPTSGVVAAHTPHFHMWVPPPRGAAETWKVAIFVPNFAEKWDPFLYQSHTEF